MPQSYELAEYPVIERTIPAPVREGVAGPRRDMNSLVRGLSLGWISGPPYALFYYQGKGKSSRQRPVTPYSEIVVKLTADNAKNMSAEYGTEVRDVVAFYHWHFSEVQDFARIAIRSYCNLRTDQRPAEKNHHRSGGAISSFMEQNVSTSCRPLFVIRPRRQAKLFDRPEAPRRLESHRRHPCRSRSRWRYSRPQGNPGSYLQDVRRATLVVAFSRQFTSSRLYLTYIKSKPRQCDPQLETDRLNHGEPYRKLRGPRYGGLHFGRSRFEGSVCHPGKTWI